MKLEDIPFQTPENGYTPREDSWLLAKSISSLEKLNGKKCLDMGCGSGIQTAALLLQGAEKVVCVDSNQDALQKTKKTVSKYIPKAKIELIESNLFEKVNKKFDLIVFNPPYVPSEKIKWTDTDGGKEGREIIDAFLEQFPPHLNEKGICLLIQTSLNGLKKTEKKLKEKGFEMKIIAEEKLAFETIFVLKINRK